MKEEKVGELEVSLVFPAYNEAKSLMWAVEKTLEVLEKFTHAYEIIIAEDGSTDGTDKIASELSKKYSTVRHLHGDKRLGRGLALKNAFNNARGEILVFMDADLATDLKHLETLIESIREGSDIAIGSRMLAESNVKRTASRRTASKFYNFMVRKLLGSKVRDHQCGFKAFKKESILQILKKTEAAHWFWDTEILVRAQHMGCKIREIPVEWKSGKETKVHLVKDSLSMGFQLVKFWWKLERERRSDKINKSTRKLSNKEKS